MTKLLVLTKEGEYKEFDANQELTDMLLLFGVLDCPIRVEVVKPCTGEDIDEKYRTDSRR